MSSFNSLTYNRPTHHNARCVVPCLNFYKLFCRYAEKMEAARDKVEKDITNFIKEEWNENLELCVELEDTGVVTIWVGEEVEKEYFYQFIINPICKKYGLKLQYTEVVKGVCSYIEWGLGNDC